MDYCDTLKKVELFSQKGWNQYLFLKLGAILAPPGAVSQTKKVEMVQVPPYQKWSHFENSAALSEEVLFLFLWGWKWYLLGGAKIAPLFQKRYCFQPFFGKRYTSWQKGTKTVPERSPSCGVLARIQKFSAIPAILRQFRQFENFAGIVEDIEDIEEYKIINFGKVYRKCAFDIFDIFDNPDTVY